MMIKTSYQWEGADKLYSRMHRFFFHNTELNGKRIANDVPTVFCDTCPGVTIKLIKIARCDRKITDSEQTETSRRPSFYLSNIYYLRLEAITAIINVLNRSALRIKNNTFQSFSKSKS